MNKFVIPFMIMLISLSAVGQALPKSPPVPRKVYYGKAVAFPDPSKENPVLVINNNSRMFVKDAKTVIDTLSAQSRYEIITLPDSIRRYSNSKFVRQVVLISTP